MNKHLFKHEVDQSLLRAGVTIPIKVYRELFDCINVDLKKGDKAQITILIEGEEYDAELIYQNVRADRTLIQIRYNQSDPITKRLRDIFSYSNQLIGKLKERDESKYPNTLIAEEQKEYIDVVAIGQGRIQFECFPATDSTLGSEKVEIGETDRVPVIDAGELFAPDQLFGMSWDADTIAMFPPEAIYFVPINAKQWDKINVVDGLFYFETFLAIKTMKAGDMLLLYVEKESIQGGIYAIARIQKGPFILSGAPDDYCNGKLTVLARIEYIRDDRPLFTKEQCKEFADQFRSTNRIKGLDEEAFDKRLREMCHVVDVPEGLTEDEEADFAQGLDLSALEQLAKKRSGVAKRVNRTETKTTSQFQRDQFISEYAKRRADGKCQLCGKEAPFNNKKGQPYLESHHVIWLSNGGEDSIDNVAALCPNCHRKMHVLNFPGDVKNLLEKIKSE